MSETNLTQAAALNGKTQADFSSTLSRDFGSTLVTQIGLLGLGAFTSVAAARILGPQGRGELVALTVWTLALVQVVALGMNQSVVFHTGKKLFSISEIWTSSAAIGAAQAVLVVSIGLAVVPLALRGYTSEVRRLGVIFLTATPVLLFLGGSYPANILQGMVDLNSFNLVSLAAPVAYAVGLTIIAALHSRELSWAVAAQVAGYASSSVLGYWLFSRRHLIRIRWNGAACSSLLKYGWKTQLGSVSNYVNQRLDQLLLSLFVAPRELGLYAVAVALTSVVGFLPGALGIVTLAKGSNLGLQDATKLVSNSFRLSVASLVLLCGGLFLVAPWLIPLVLGREFVNSTLPCRILLPGTVALGTARVLYDGARALGDPILAFYAEGAAMAVTCGGLYLLLPRYGIVGAALTSSLAYSFALAVVLALFRVRLGIGLKDLLFGR